LHCANIANREFGSDLPKNSRNPRSQASRVAIASHYQRDRVRVALEYRNIEHCDRFQNLEPTIPDVLDDANDFPDYLRREPDAKAVAQRIFARPEPVRHGPADDRYRLFAGRIREAEVPTRNPRNPHRPEITGGRPPDRHVALEREHLDWPALDGDGLLGPALH